MLPGDVDALATTLDKALNGGVDLAALGRAAAATARRNLDIPAVGAEYARVFAAVATPAEPTPAGGDAALR